MTPDSTQPVEPTLNSPQRATLQPMPVQRGNYGIPPRRPLAAAEPTSVPVSAVTSAVASSTPITATAAPTMNQLNPQGAATRVMDVTPARAVPPPTPAPLSFTPPVTASNTMPVSQPTAKTAANVRQKKRSLLPKLMLVLLVVGGVLLISGTARWATAGSTANDKITVGAVTANNGSQTALQFTADDGRLHSLSVKGGGASLIPGNAVEVAYQSGAPDTTAKLISRVQSAHNLGVSLLMGGVALLVVGAGLCAFDWHKRRAQPPTIMKARPLTSY